ncbi:histidine kinase [Actinomycetes bacterium KLBMP 9797]
MRSFARGAWRGLRRFLAGPEYPPVRLPRGRAWLASAGVLLLIALAAVTAQGLVDGRRLPMLSSITLALLAVAPLPFLLSRPLVAARLVVLGEFFGTFNREPDEAWPWAPVQVLVIILVLLVVAARVDRPVLVWFGLFSLIPVWIFVRPHNVAGITLLFAALLIVGDLLGRTARIQRALAEQSRALAEQSEISELEKARRAVLEERARIARELHDVVAHHMSMIAVRAETAPYRLAELPDPVREEFTGIAGAARGALTDMRRLLGVLRSEGADPPKAPQPGLPDVPELVANAQQAGVTATLDVAGGPDPPEAVGLAAYRIVQEALANASRHAPGAAVRVEIRPWRQQLFVRIHNGPAAQPPAGRAPGTGHGLAGMRERTGLLGGEFAAGPTGEGGFEVEARLPYHAGGP